MTTDTDTWSTSISGQRPIIGQSRGIPVRTFNEALIEQVEKDPNRIQYVTADGTNVTLADFYSLSSKFAKSSMHLGLQPYEGVAILGFNSIPWFAADVGATLAAAIPAGIYTSNKPDICAYIINHSKCRIACVDDKEALDKILSVLHDCPVLEAIVIWGRTDLSQYAQHKDILYTWDQFLDLSPQVSDSLLDARIKLPTPRSICKVIYTSGTTGPPKAVMISHDNVAFTVRLVGEMINASPQDRMVSFLPSSHIAANSIDICGAILNGFCVTFAAPDALKGSLVKTLKEVRPTILVAVPRVYEKIQEKLLQIGAQSGPIKRAISTWAKGIGTQANEARDRGDEMMPWGYRLADMLVFSNVKKALGLDCCKLVINVAAPLQKATDNYFRSLDIRILELYGMSEATGPLVANFPDYKRFSCGKPVQGIEVKLHNKDETGEGELCFRGRNIFVGYMNNEEETSKAIDDEGYVHSGDLGRMDENGFITLTGRAKELIITAGGENVAPALIERSLISNLPAISRAFPLGDQQKFMSCLLVPYMDEAGNLIGPATTVNPEVKTAAEAVDDASWDKYIMEGIEKANKEAISNAARVRKYTLLTKDFSVEGGELTPTLKVKRKIVVQMYSEIIGAMYA